MDIVKCWCGAVGTEEELFSADFDFRCGGAGELQCFCGGDLCVCHNHGVVECPGCDDCWDEDDDFDYFEDERGA